MRLPLAVIFCILQGKFHDLTFVFYPICFNNCFLFFIYLLNLDFCFNLFLNLLKSFFFTLTFEEKSVMQAGV